MSARERILTIRLLELIRLHPEYAGRIGIEGGVRMAPKEAE